MRTFGRVSPLLLVLACTAHPPTDVRLEDEGRAGAPAITVDVADPWATPGDEPWRDCAHRECIGGRIRVTRIDGRFTYASLLEVVPSSMHHPNGERSGEIRIADTPRTLELDHTYEIVAGAFSMEGWHAVLVLDDDAEGRARVSAILRSPHAFENGDAWQRRRAAWAGFADLVDRKESWDSAAITVWEESEDGRWLALAIGGVVWIYDHAHRKLTVHSETAKIHGINRIVWKHGGFVLWSDAEPMAIVVPGADKLERRVPLATDDAARLRALFDGYRRARAKTQHHAPDDLGAWGCDRMLTRLSTGDYVYDAKDDRGWFVNPQKAEPGLGYNRITWDDELDGFAFWSDQELWLRAL